MVPSCLAREGSEDARARRDASVLPRSDLLLIWADRRGVSSPQNSPSGKWPVIKKEMVEYKPDLIRGRRCMRGGRLTWGRGSHRRKTPRAEKDKDRVRIGSGCQTADVIESY